MAINSGGVAEPSVLRFYEDTDNTSNDTYISLESGDVNGGTSTPIMLILPDEVPTVGQVLKSQAISGGKNQLYWAADNTTAAGATDATIIGLGTGNGNVTFKFEGTSTNDLILTWYDIDNNTGAGVQSIPKDEGRCRVTRSYRYNFLNLIYKPWIYLCLFIDIFNGVPLFKCLFHL